MVIVQRSTFMDSLLLSVVFPALPRGVASRLARWLWGGKAIGSPRTDLAWRRTPLSTRRAGEGGLEMLTASVAREAAQIAGEEEEVIMTFGSYLRELRRTRGVPQRRLAEALGMTPRALVDLESNRRPPGLDELRRLAAFFGIAEDEFLRRAGYLGSSRPVEPSPRQGMPGRGAVPRSEREWALLHLSGR